MIMSQSLFLLELWILDLVLFYFPIIYLFYLWFLFSLFFILDLDKEV